MNTLLYILLILITGSSFLAIHYVVLAYPPIFGAMIRVGLATLLILPYAWKTNRNNWPRGHLAMRCMMTGFFCLTIPSALIFWGQTVVAPAPAAIILCSSPIFATLAEPLFDRPSSPTLQQWIGIVLGFCGILFVLSPRLMVDSHTKLWGLLAILGASISFGIVIPILHPITKRVSSSVLLVYQGIPAFLMLAILSRAIEKWPTWTTIISDTQTLVAMGYLALVVIVLGYIIWFQLIKTLGTVTTASAAFFYPIVAIVLDALFLHRIPYWQSFVGTAIIIGGVALTKWTSPQSLPSCN
ncbi:MAG: hypothetical protein COV45_01385 [Deltaproteobacteria bacterium CG11_big_fil_rev_8_21_14_0_20_47_16]|nr:MAG: hypothetical protein COV45_01385 [Deltaproteobacteria bacterium CG11_big_fil_rev_8_21_14_0_20_47_16]